MNTKEKLINSAIKLFSDKGFEATSTTSICSDAGFSSAALFVHFRTKNDLLDYIYLDIKRQYFQHANKEINLSADIFTIAGDIMFQGWEYYYKNPENFFFIKKFLNSFHLSRIAKQEVEKELQPIFNFYDTGKKQNRIIDIDNKLLFDMVTGAYYGLIEYSISSKNNATHEHMDIILNIIKK